MKDDWMNPIKALLDDLAQILMLHALGCEH